MPLPNQKLLTSNIILSAAVALFMYFLVQTPLAHATLLFAIKVLVNVHFALLDNRSSLVLTPQGLTLDALVVLSCALIWTVFSASYGRIIAITVLGLVSLSAALALFANYGILSASLLIVGGVGACMALETAYEYFTVRFRRKITAEKSSAEYNVLRHLNHNVRPAVMMARSPLTAVQDFLEERGLLGEALAERLDGSNETVGEALAHALAGLDHISESMESTRKLVTHEIPAGEFSEENIADLLERDVIPLAGSRLEITVLRSGSCRARLHRQSFVEAMLNLIRNAEVHGFPEGQSGGQLVFEISEQRRRIVIDYTNNGRPFPENLSAADFTAFGRKSADSPGEGLGGAWIGKMVAAHNGTFQIIRDGHPLHFQIKLPKGRI